MLEIIIKRVHHIFLGLTIAKASSTMSLWVVFFELAYYFQAHAYEHITKSSMWRKEM